MLYPRAGFQLFVLHQCRHAGAGSSSPLQTWAEGEMSLAPRSVAQDWCKGERRLKCCSVTVSAWLHWLPEIKRRCGPLHPGVHAHLRHWWDHLPKQVQLLQCCGVSEGAGSREGFLDPWVLMLVFRAEGGSLTCEVAVLCSFILNSLFSQRNGLDIDLRHKGECLEVKRRNLHS